MPRALHIDPWTRTVTEVEVPADSSLSRLQELVGGYIECATELPNGDTLYVDEEGLLKADASTMFFDVGAHQPFAGKGVLVGAEDEDGNLTDAKTANDGQLVKRYLTMSEVARGPAA